MSDHTKEPWRLNDQFTGSIFYEEQCIGRCCEPLSKANAQRIVACVNFLKGIPTEQIEGKDVAEYVSEQAFINGMLPNDSGGATLSINGAACQMLAASFAGQFAGSGAINYLELKLEHKEVGPFVVTMQKSNGKTPAELRFEAEQQRDKLLAALEEIKNLPDVRSDEACTIAGAVIAEVKGQNNAA